MKKILSAALAVLLVCCCSLSAFAFEYKGEKYPDEYWAPNPGPTSTPASFDSYKQVVLYENGNQLVLIGLWGEGSMVMNDDGNVIMADGSYYFVHHNWDGSRWISTGQVSSIPKNGTVIEGKYLAWSRYDIKDASGNVVFPAAPWMEQVQGVANQAMMEQAMEMMKTMGLLTVSGVGLMVLLIGLALFGKRSLLFRS